MPSDGRKPAPREDHATTPPTLDLRLRDVSAEDLPIFFEHQMDPEANRMAAFPPRDRDAFTDHWTNKVLGDVTGRRKTVVVDEQVVGNVVSFSSGGEREVGYWIGREHWGRGIATAALSEFLRLEPERPLFAYVAKHNVASIRVLEKCGFRVVGEERRPPDVGGDDVVEVRLTLDA